MTFLRRQLPLIICFIMGLIFAAQYYIPHQASEDLLTKINDWFIIIGIFGAFLGIYSILHIHATKIKRHTGGWGFSVVVIIAIIATLTIGIISKGEVLTPSFNLSSFGWVYNNMLVSLNATVFSLLAFFIASVAFRTFRAKNFEAILLLLAAIIVMLGRVPLGEYIWSQLFSTKIPGISDIAGWIMDTPNMAARRGILLGVTLGVIATSLKIIMGIERAYLGGGKDK